MKTKIYKLINTIILLILTNTNIVYATNYYVSNYGNNLNNGKNKNAPWQTLSKVNNSMYLFKPGDSILFSRNNYFYGTLNITKSGNNKLDIVFGNYGKGKLPKWQYDRNGGSTYALSNNNNVSYITIDGFEITDTTIDIENKISLAKIKYAFIFNVKCSNITIKNCDISLIGIGVSFTGNNHNFLNNKVHNLRTVRSTLSPNYDDYGANGVVLSKANNTKIMHNYFESNWAYMIDFGNDGGAIEFFGPCSENEIMYNQIIDCGGVGEFGSDTKGTSRNNLIAYNLIINSGLLSWCNISGIFSINVINTKYYNNTIIETPADRFQQPYLFSFNGKKIDSIVFNIKNNIFYISNEMSICNPIIDHSKIVHENNIYQFLKNNETNYGVDKSELITKEKIINSNNGDPKNWNYHPFIGSISINFGIDVGIKKDYEGNTIEELPDAGYLELKRIKYN